jgi:hypothetical protein
MFSWAASGRSLSLARDKGLTKVLFDEATGRVVGAGIVGRYAGELIAEIAHGIEMGADAADLALTITGTPRCRRPQAWRPGPSKAPSPARTCRKRSRRAHTGGCHAWFGHHRRRPHADR